MKKLLVGTFVVVLVAIGVMGGTVLAQSADENGTGAGRSFADRVAEILGLDSETVEDAMRQAKTDMQNEWLDAWLAKSVEAGKMTQEQADEYGEWYRSRPEGAWPGFGHGGKKHFRHGGHRGFHGKFMYEYRKPSESEAPAAEGTSL